MSDHQKVTVRSGRTLVDVACSYCGRNETLTASSLIRGTEYTCEGCGANIATIPGGLPSGHTATLNVKNKLGSHSFDITVRRDGVWNFADANERSVAEVLDHDSDRAVAIIVGAMIEGRIKAAILSQFNRHEKIEERLFHHSGPLGSFSAKIDLAYLRGIISLEAHADLVTFKDIRNLFAHNLSIKDFRSTRIKDKAKNLTLVDTRVGEFKKAKDSPIVNFDPNEMLRIWISKIDSRRRSAKERYLITAQLFSVALAPAGLPGHQTPVI